MYRKVKSSGLHISYEKNDEFNALIRRCSSLPFVGKEKLDEAFQIITERAEALNDKNLKDFSQDLIDYLNSQWRHGVFSIQDWTISDVNLMTVPTTNNGQEGQNRRFKENFGIYPKFWDFILSVNDELETCSHDILQIDPG